MSTTINSTALNEFRNSISQLGDNVVREQLSDDERVRRAKQTFASKLDGRMAVDLETCIHCGMCAEACHFYEATENEAFAPVRKLNLLRRFYRRELSPFRLFFRPFTRDLTIDDLKEWQPLVYDACTNCGRCDMMCPMGISLSPMIRVMRAGLASAGLVPDELQALEDEQKTQGSVFGVGSNEFRQYVAKLQQQGIEIPLDKTPADVVVLTTAVEVRLFGESLAATAKIMRKLGVNWTLLSDAFEATNVGMISGGSQAQKKVTSDIVARVKACGATTVIVPETGHAYQSLRWEGANDIGAALPFEVLALSEFLDREIKVGNLKLKQSSGNASVTYHDPCRLGRQSGVYEEPRSVLKALGLNVRETASNRRENYCCGGGCAEYVIKRSAPLRQKAFEIKKRELDAADADTVITTCANCRVNLLIGAENSGWTKPIEGLAERVAASLAD
jgi:Fe-S oxidoreductase